MAIALASPPIVNDILKEIEPFLQSQIQRIKTVTEHADIEIRTVPVTLAKHAAGEKRPSLSQQELEDQTWTPRRQRIS